MKFDLLSSSGMLPLLYTSFIISIIILMPKSFQATSISISIQSEPAALFIFILAKTDRFFI